MTPEEGSEVFGNSWRLGRVAGVEIRIDTSWAVIAVLVAYSLYVEFSLTYVELSTPAAVVLASAAALVFFGSVLTHEMAHAVVARRRGIEVRGITLFMFGGATHAKVESRGPLDEFVISVVGPLTSLALAGVLWVVASVGEAILPDPVPGAVGYLAWVNLVLAVFNLVPGFPLDGGRLLRSAIWRATGSLSRATRIAAIAGQTVGYLLVAAGLLLLFGGRVGGLWFAAIGWFLAQAARSSYEQLQVRRMLEQVDAEDVMARDLVPIPSDVTLQEAVDRYFMRLDHGAFPVEEEGRAVGMITLRGVKQIPREEWGRRLVRDTMSSLDEQARVGHDAPMDRVLARLEDGVARRVLVVRDGEVVGIITSGDVARWLRRRSAVEDLRG